jgi:hypothetical protein
MVATVNKQPPQHELITPAEYARRRGVSRAAVTKAILRCRIPLVDGLLDPLVADTLWKARTDPEQQRRALAQQRPHESPANLDVPHDNWRERHEKANALRAELELQVLRGKLGSLDEMNKLLSGLASAIVQRLMSIPDRISAEFGVDDAHRIKLRHRLAEELDQVRAEFARADIVETAT